LRSELETGAPESVVAQARAIDDALVACVFLVTVKGEVPLYVSDSLGLYYYTIDFVALQKPNRAWLVPESIARGEFLVVRRLMLDQSREAKLEGNPLFVDPKKLLTTLRQRPSIKECVKSVIGEADQNGLELTNAEIVAAVQERGVYASKSQILRAKPLKPVSWSKPGPKRNRPAT
jgi:hypothetical protein